MNPFNQIGLRLRAKLVVRDAHTQRRLNPGECGVVIRYYPYTVVIRPDGKKLPVETEHFEALEKINTEKI